jgi:arsenate reductase-like glutaredoxin family protein
VPASRKLQVTDARELLEKASRLIAMKGKKVQEFAVAKSIPDEAVAAMLGPTGNLRAPTVVRGKTVLVGFNDEIFTKTLG